MSQRIGDTVTIEREPARTCMLCGRTAEVRPYGPNGEDICYDCGQKDPEGTLRRTGITLFGMTPTAAAEMAKDLTSTPSSDRRKYAEAIAKFISPATGDFQ